MRELVLKMSVSLDGFVAGPGGEIAWMFGGDPAPKAWGIAIASEASLHVMGSRTFVDMAAFWPSSTDAYAPAMNGIAKAVFSRRDDVLAALAAARGAVQPEAASWAKAYVARGELADEIAALKAVDGEPIVAHGGAAFARSLVAHGLVDRYALLVHPVVLGAGMPLWTEVAQPRRLRLVDATPFPGGSLGLIYRPT